MSDILPPRSINTPILQIDGLFVSFKTPLGWVRAAEDVFLDLQDNETLALVGETGCGKSVVASAIMQLLPGNASIQGRILFQGRDLLALGEKKMACIRGSEVAIIFQNPSLALNPIMNVNKQVAEPLQIHKGLFRRLSIKKAEELLSRLGLGKRGMARLYPFQLSGGMNQRVMIATSLILSPRIIIADEPSKGLDAALAREVMGELARFREEIGTSLLLITHDLELAREISDRMAVMYCGEIVETGPSQEIFAQPLHPYTEALLNCLPEKGFQPILGISPSMIEPPKGCRFHPRCPKRGGRCQERPDMMRIKGRDEGMDRMVRCWLY